MPRQMRLPKPPRPRGDNPDQMSFDLGPNFRTAAESAALAAMDDTSIEQSDDPSARMPYRPTPSINPPRPRTQAAGYNKDTGVMTVQFREGAVYEYYGVSQNEWRNFRRVKSPGKAINRTFNHKSYSRRFDLESG